MARIIEECIRHKAKLILIDATGEYRKFDGDGISHCHLGEPFEKGQSSVACSLPPTSFLESDFVALFEPAGKVQGPKLRAAMRSLRLATIRPDLAPDGKIRKHDQLKQPVLDAELAPEVSSLLDDPRQPFDVCHLVAQIEQECVWPNGGNSRAPDSTRWGGPDDGSYANCLAAILAYQRSPDISGI